MNLSRKSEVPVSRDGSNHVGVNSREAREGSVVSRNTTPSTDPETSRTPVLPGAMLSEPRCTSMPMGSTVDSLMSSMPCPSISAENDDRSYPSTGSPMSTMSIS